MDILCAGEVMVELAPVEGATDYRRSYAGDSFNTAVYLARLGLATAYLTRLGDDTAAGDILALMRREALDSSLVQRIAGCNTGLYLIDNDPDGERHFTYYRDRAPVRQLFDQPVFVDTPVFYFTGITLAVTRTGLENFQACLQALQHSGTQIVFDPNFRPHLWHSPAQAESHYQAILPYCHLVLPSLEDDRNLWGLQSTQESLSFYRQYGAREVVVKGGMLLAEAWCELESASRTAEPRQAIDTTGAGDAFNAGYLARRLRGASMEESLGTAQTLAAKVVQHRGAIIPRADMETGH